MKILFEHNGILPVSKYGGTERILFWHMKELVRRGHHVCCISPQGSSLTSYGIEHIVRGKSEDWRKLVPNDIDMLHLFYTPRMPLDFPFMVTIGGNGKVGEVFLPNTVFVSRRHASLHGSDQYVYNGLDLEEYPLEDKWESKNWDRFLFLGKANWKVKNLRDCVRACKATNKHLHIAGGKAMSWSSLIHSHGMVDQRQKLTLIRQTDALLWPVRWQEPFGLAVIEAFSQGCPVIASRYGSSPELVTEDVGVLCDDWEGFIQILERRENVFNPATIRKHVEARFTVEKMTRRYLELYELILSGESLNKTPPRYQGSERPETLLPF